MKWIWWLIHTHFASFNPKKYVWHIFSIKKHVSLTDLNLCITLISATSCTGRHLSSTCESLAHRQCIVQVSGSKARLSIDFMDLKVVDPLLVQRSRCTWCIEVLSTVPSSMLSWHVQYSSENISSTFFPKKIWRKKSCWNQGQVTSLDFKLAFWLNLAF